MPNEYYRIQQKKHTGELRYIAYCLVGLILVLIFGLIGQCCFKDERKIVKARQPTMDQKLSIIDEVYTKRVEANIKEMGKE